jgi:SAM-dependent methyltransferase
VAKRRGTGTWSDGDAYEAYVGRWSRLVARRFLSWLAPGDHLRWLDVGSGTGALSTVIAATSSPRGIVGVDASEAYVEEARRRVQNPKVRFEQGDASSLAYHREFDAAVSGLVMNFLVNPAAAVDGMKRAVVDDGVVSAYVWDYAGGMQLMRYFWDAAAAVDRSACGCDEGLRFPLAHPEQLTALWDEGGLRSVETTTIDVNTHFNDFNDYWMPFLGGQGPAPQYVMSLGEPRRVALREAVRSALPIDPDGSIRLVARAWAVKGRRMG